MIVSGRRYAVSMCWIVAICSCMGVGQQKRIYIANDDHTDYVWTASESDYRTAFLAMLDFYLNQADSTASNPSDFQGRFSADGNFWMWTYEKNKSPEDFQRLISRIQDGHITVPLQTLVLCYGGMPAEAVLRSMYYAGRIERVYNMRFTLVSAMENQTLPFGLPSLWAGAGAKYSWKGVCGCASKLGDEGQRAHEIYRAVGPDGQSVLMKWHSQQNLESLPAYGSGGYAEARNTPGAVDFASTNPLFLSRYPFDQVVGMFGYGGDDFQTMTTGFITTAQMMSNASRRVIVSNELDFFKDFESSAPPDSIPSYSGGFGNEWEMCEATMSEVTASVKRSVEDLRSAEALATYASLTNPSFMSARSSSTDSAFTYMGLYFEHDWTDNGPVSAQRPAFQRRLASQINNYVAKLKSDAASALAAEIPNPAAGKRFFVFNPLSWTRTDFADIPGTFVAPIRVVDVTTGLQARSQIVTLSGQTYLRILAEGVPSVGYKVYEIQQGASQFGDSAAAFSNGNTVFENDKYRVTVDGRGAMPSIIDKRDGNRELVKSIGGLSMNDIGSGGGIPAPENVGPVSATLFVDAGGSPAHRTRITLYRTIDRIDVEDEILSNFGDAVTTFGFGFNLTAYTVRHEEIGGIAVADYVSHGGNYSDITCRYDYFTMNHFVDISDGQRGCTLSNWDSQFFKLGNSDGYYIDVATPQVKALVGGRIDAIWGTGVPNQDGDSYFRNRYALQRHGAFSASGAMKMALEHQNPLVTSYVTGAVAGSFPPTTFSLLSISDSNAIAWCVKPSEEGISNGIIIRLWNVDQTNHAVSLTFNSGNLTGARTTSHIETDIAPVSLNGNSITDNLPAQRLQTYRLLTDAVIPTELESFRATITGPRTVKVEWTTNSESGVSGFEIQRKRVQDTDFQKIGFVTGQGTSSSPHSYSFLDTTITSGDWLYRLKQDYLDGTYKVGPLVTIQIVTGIGVNGLPTEFRLYQNYPNPFNPGSLIGYDVPHSGRVTVVVYDLLGEEVVRLVDELKEPGRYQIRFDAQQLHLSSGVYFYRLEAGSFVSTRKMLVLK